MKTILAAATLMAATTTEAMTLNGAYRSNQEELNFLMTQSQVNEGKYIAAWTGEEILNNATDGIEHIGEFRSYSDIRKDDLQARWERVVTNYDPDVDLEFADKIRNQQKTV